jgi:hypothetical protein
MQGGIDGANNNTFTSNSQQISHSKPKASGRLHKLFKKLRATNETYSRTEVPTDQQFEPVHFTQAQSAQKASDEKQLVKKLSQKQADLQMLFDKGKDAIRHSREFLSLKAVNKDYGTLTPWIPHKKLERYSPNALSVRELLYRKYLKAQQEHIRQLERSPDQFKAELIPGQRIQLLHDTQGAEVTGTCEDYALLIYDYLTKQDPPIRHDIVQLKDPGDHAFNVINPPKKNSDGSYPPFSKWPEDSIVVDGWANIIALAKKTKKTKRNAGTHAGSFSDQWVLKMHKWADRGLEIHGELPESPLNKKWLNAMTDFKMESWFDCLRSAVGMK